MSHFSLRTKILVVLLGTTLFFGLSMILFARTVIYQKLFTKIQEKGAVMAKRTASDCVNPVVTDELFEIEMMFKDMMDSEKDIVYIFAMDKGKSVLAHTFSGGFPDELKTAHEVNPLDQYAIKVLTTDRGIILDFGVPLLKGEIGVLRMGISEASIRRDVNGIVMLIILFSLFVMIAGSIVATIFSNVITRPILKLAGEAAAFGRVEMSQDVITSSADEIRELVIIFNAMIKNRKKAEQSLRESEERHRTILQTAMDGFLLTDEQGRLLEVNEAYCRMSGYSAQELMTMSISDLYAVESADASAAHYEKIMAQGEDRFESRHRRKDGSVFDVEVSTKYWPENRRFVGFICDITQRKRAQEKVMSTLKEKEVMLQEIHHRVKNNLQVILSLLSLQQEGITDSRVRVMFEESRNRIKSMALIHEKLYESTDMAHVDFKAYLQTLVSGIANTYKRDDIVCTVEMEPVTLNVNVGIPCGLIVNELVSNSLKYAFPQGKKGTVMVGICINTDGTYFLTAADNGIGIPEEVDFRNTSSLGLMLVNVLTRQLRGTIELSRENGTRFSITFPGRYITEKRRAD